MLDLTNSDLSPITLCDFFKKFDKTFITINKFLPLSFLISFSFPHLVSHKGLLW